MGYTEKSEAWLASRTGYGWRTYTAYVPHSLRGWSPTMDAATVAALTNADRALSSIVNLPHSNIGHALAEWANARDESIRSSAIENVHTTNDALIWARYRSEVGAPIGANEALTLGAVQQIRAAVELGQRMSDGHQCTAEDLRFVHSKLFERTRERDIAGVVRDSPIWIGPAGCLIDQATFVPPPPERINGLIDDLIAYMNRRDHPAVLAAALVHAQFETIHPFEDGNGRTGRALIQTMLNAYGLASGTVPISTALEQNRYAYYQALNSSHAVHTEQDTTSRDAACMPWVNLFSEACVNAHRHASATSSKVELIAERWTKAARFRSDSAASKMLKLLPAMPVVDAATAAELLGVTPRVARNALKSLARAGIIAPVGASRNVRYTAPDITSALHDSSPDGVMPSNLRFVTLCTENTGQPLNTGSTPADSPSVTEQAKQAAMSAYAGQRTCGHKGVRSGLRCHLPFGHNGQHRY